MEHLIEIKNITKKFPGVVALNHMSFSVLPGEVHGLIGENGAGKSTLIKVLTGVYKPEEGEIFVNGTKMDFKSPNDARQAGIACVYQELNIIKELSITDNIFLNRMMKKGHGLLDYPAMNKIAREVMVSLGKEVDVTQPAGNFGMGILQMVEIAKAILQDVKIIIMDEPTSSLGEREVEELFKTVRELKSRGVAILFVSHKLEELFILCDRVTVIRDGEHIVTDHIGDMTNEKLITAMVGRNVTNKFPKAETTRGKVALEFSHVSSAGELNDVSFKAHYGEILGFAGLVGAGRTETMRAIFGDLPIDSGVVSINGETAVIKNPRDAVSKKIAFLTEDRKGQGLVLNQTILTNLILSNLKRFSNGLFINKKKVGEITEANVADLRIKTPSTATLAGQLSGGNQQKVVIGKWVNTEADIYLFDEPTRGIDVGAKVEVYNIMNSLLQQGKCIIMVSSELPEILGMSDRVIVMRSGQVMAEIERGSKNFNQEQIMHAAWGGKINEN